MFALAVPLSPAAVEFLKSELRRLLPEVKSSHRCEALARGLGFRTFASLLASENCSAVIPDAAAFAGYLRDHGFVVGQKAFYDVMARRALRQVHDTYESLQVFGWGAGEPQYGHGRWETPTELQERRLENRSELLGEGAVRPFLASLCLLARIQATRTIRADAGSYRLKHVAENYPCTYPGGEPLGPCYVPNGIFIAAAIHSGFRFKTWVTHRGYDNLNVTFNMSKKIVGELDAEMRPGRATRV